VLRCLSETSYKHPEILHLFFISFSNPSAFSYESFFHVKLMEFYKNIPAEGRVEDWMTNVLHEMRSTNRLITKEAVFTYCLEK